MKYFLFFMLFFTYLWSKSIQCAVPKNIYPKVASLFENPIEYTHTKVIIKTYLDNIKALQALQDKNTTCAIVRSDVLWNIQAGVLNWASLKGNYITIATLPYMAQLYLVRSDVFYDMDLENLKKKVVSIGTIGQENGYLLKSLLHLYNVEHTVHYKSIPFLTSLKAITNNELDAFFGFLPPSLENDQFHFQTIFSEQSTSFFEKKSFYTVDYNGIHVSYTIVVSKDASDEEMENIIYRLEEHSIFKPQTDEHYGPVNRYVLQHLAQIKSVLLAKMAKINRPSIKIPNVSSKLCLTYHYGFLDLLRRKPAMKKKLKFIKSTYPKRYVTAKKFLYASENILLNIDKKKHSCNLNFLKQKKIQFQQIEKNISTLTK